MSLSSPLSPSSSSSSVVLTIAAPSKNDVLCGRGQRNFHHEGNQRFRTLIAEYSDYYKMAPSKKEKMKVIQLVTDIVIHTWGGRFLIAVNKPKQVQKDNITTTTTTLSTTSTKNNGWIDGGSKQGKKKTGHAFRDALRGRVKCMTKIMSDDMSLAKPPTTMSSTTMSSSSSSSTSTTATEDSFLDDMSSVSSSTSQEFPFESIIDEYDIDVMRQNSMPLEPSINWRHEKIDIETAIDLLDFFIMDALR